MKATPRLSLGTANLAQRYGFGQRRVLNTLDSSFEILEHARLCGIVHIDTAASYGQAEAILGEFGCRDFQITTKLPSLRAFNLTSEQIPPSIVHQAVSSVQRLQVSAVQRILLHDPTELNKQALAEAHIEGLLRIKEEGLAKEVGISLYDPQTLEDLRRWGLLHVIDAVQAPYNPFDTRIVTAMMTNRLKKNMLWLIARSVFLQGVLTTRPHHLPRFFRPYDKYLREWWNYVDSRSMDPAHALLSFVDQAEVVDEFVVGVESPSHLRDAVSFLNSRQAFHVPAFSVPASLRDPRLWLK